MPCATQELQNEYCREHYKNVVGCRLRESGMFYRQYRDGTLIQFKVTPDDFLVRTGGVTRPFEIYKKDIYIHVPRSLCTRARIYVNKLTGAIVSNQPAPACLNK